MSPDWTQLERIYLRLPNWVGDVVLATPALHALRRAAPQATIGLHGRGLAFKVLGSEGLHDRALVLKKKGGPLWPFLEGRRVREELEGAPDIAILFPNSISSAIVAKASGAPIRPARVDVRIVEGPLRGARRRKDRFGSGHQESVQEARSSVASG